MNYTENFVDFMFFGAEEKIVRAISNGIPLPEHHGRLIDADKLTRAEIMHLWYHLPNGDIACPKGYIYHAPTIIEGSDSDEASD